MGASVYAAFRTFAPVQLAFATSLIGASVGLGARLGRSFGTPNQLRVIIFGSLFTFVSVEALVFSKRQATNETFIRSLIDDPTWLGFSLIFLICGIIFGIRILVGNDPVGDVLEHGVESASGTGTRCPKCGSHQTIFDEHSKLMRCETCEFEWRATG